MNVANTDTTESHYIEQSVQVYLHFEAGQWVIDPITLDGYALDSVHGSGASNSACECGSSTECQAARAVANTADLPTGRQLYTLLGEAINRST